VKGEGRQEKARRKAVSAAETSRLSLKIRKKTSKV